MSSHLEQEPSQTWQEHIAQSPLFDAEDGRAPEILLERVVVETAPVYTKRHGGNLWQCQVHAPPDIFHQERNETYQVQARAYSQEAQKLHLAPGDLVTLTGIPSIQEIETAGGEKQRIHQLSVTRIEVLSRAKRVSLTVYEKHRGK